MKLVVQRVKQAKVVRMEDKKVVGEIGLGLFVLFGVKKDDTLQQADVLAEKLVKLRVMSDDQEKMNLSVKDTGSKILVVSQFTLYADTSGGNRPSFVNAEAPDMARKIYDHFVEKVRSLGVSVETGSFGDYMQIETVLDGPVTIIYE